MRRHNQGWRKLNPKTEKGGFIEVLLGVGALVMLFVTMWLFLAAFCGEGRCALR